MTRTKSVVTVLVMLYGTVSLRAQEQTVFSAEDTAVKRPVALPPDVLELLKTDPFATDAFRHDSPAACFSASAIRLGARETDLIVEAEGCLRGANENMFWIFVATTHGHHLVMGAPALQLTIEKHQTNGYRDVTLQAATADKVTTTALKFNGRQYTLQREKEERIR